MVSLGKFGHFDQHYWAEGEDVIGGEEPKGIIWL